MKKILIIIQRSNGDVLLSQSLISSLYQYFENPYIDLLVNDDTLNVARLLTNINFIHTFSYKKKLEKRWKQEKDIPETMKGYVEDSTKRYKNEKVNHGFIAQEVKEAIDILHETCPDLVIDGEIQADFALNPKMLKEKFPFSKLVGKNVNGLIFPNLDSANINYKLLKELNEIDSIGPVIMGLTKPAHVLQLGASVDEIVNMTALAVVDAQNKSGKKK